jgi:hypothetical protein
MSTPLVQSTENGNLDVGTAPKKKQKITKWFVVKVAIILVITIALFFVGHYAIPRAPLPPGFRQPTDGRFRSDQNFFSLSNNVIILAHQYYRLSKHHLADYYGCLFL